MVGIERRLHNYNFRDTRIQKAIHLRNEKPEVVFRPEKIYFFPELKFGAFWILRVIRRKM